MLMTGTTFTQINIGIILLKLPNNICYCDDVQKREYVYWGMEYTIV